MLLSQNTLTRRQVECGSTLQASFLNTRQYLDGTFFLTLPSPLHSRSVSCMLLSFIVVTFCAKKVVTANFIKYLYCGCIWKLRDDIPSALSYSHLYNSNLAPFWSCKWTLKKTQAKFVASLRTRISPIVWKCYQSALGLETIFIQQSCVEASIARLEKSHFCLCLLGSKKIMPVFRHH